MLRTLTLVAAVLTLSACVVTEAPSPAIISAQPTGPNIYTNAPRGELHSELFACSSWGANLGEIGERGESLLYTPYVFTPAGALLRNPTQSACLSSGFGWRGEAEGGGRVHNGVDLANAHGGFVYAAGEAWVVSAGWRGGLGIVLELDHGRGVRTMYAHLSDVDPNLRPGVFVAAGQAVARMGATGNATGVHLHYQISVDGLLVDPLRYGPAPAGDAAPIL
jgi:murein DD-endopeptidase MepM/ murein hydrolase activator NlpD